MPPENVEGYRRATDAFNRRDIDAFLEDLDPEVVMHLSLPAMFGGQAPHAGQPSPAAGGFSQELPEGLLLAGGRFPPATLRLA